jgi:hypothetical protein
MHVPDKRLTNRAMTGANGHFYPNSKNSKATVLTRLQDERVAARRVDYQHWQQRSHLKTEAEWLLNWISEVDATLVLVILLLTRLTDFVNFVVTHYTVFVFVVTVVDRAQNATAE